MDLFSLGSILKQPLLLFPISCILSKPADKSDDAHHSGKARPGNPGVCHVGDALGPAESKSRVKSKRLLSILFRFLKSSSRVISSPAPASHISYAHISSTHLLFLIPPALFSSPLSSSPLRSSSTLQFITFLHLYSSHLSFSLLRFVLSQYLSPPFSPTPLPSSPLLISSLFLTSYLLLSPHSSSPLPSPPLPSFLLSLLKSHCSKAPTSSPNL